MITESVKRLRAEVIDAEIMLAAVAADNDALAEKINDLESKRRWIPLSEWLQISHHRGDYEVILRCEQPSIEWWDGSTWKDNKRRESITGVTHVREIGVLPEECYIRKPPCAAPHAPGKGDVPSVAVD